jgi:Tol biopolymer transport system component
MTRASTRSVVCFGTALLAIAACRDTNIVDPSLGSDAGGVIVFASNRIDNNFEIYRIGADGRGLRRLTTAREYNDRAPVLSPDGTRIAWEREIATSSGDLIAVEIWMMNADGSDPHVVVRNGSFNRAPSLGPTGEIVFASRLSGSDQIFRLSPSATEPVRLTNSGAADQNPRISPDGSQIVFQSNRGLDFDIYTMNADGSGVVNLTRAAGDDRFPSWSPDGSRIAWTRFESEANGFDVYSMPAGGGEAAVVVATVFNELAPSISPDGRSIVYQTDRAPPFTLYTVPVSGGEGRPLRPVEGLSPGFDLAPWWGPSP